MSRLLRLLPIGDGGQDMNRLTAILAAAGYNIGIEHVPDAEPLGPALAASQALAIEAAELGLFEYDPVSGTMFCSGLARRYLGLPPDAVLTLADFLDSAHPRDELRIKRAIADAMNPQAEGRYAEEYRVRVSDGEDERWVSAWGKVFFDASARPARFPGMVRDISPRKRAERDLQFQLQLTACIAEQSADCILLTDREGKTRFVNPEAERVFGFTAREFQESSVHDLLRSPPEDTATPENESILARMAASGGMLRDEERVFCRKDGAPIDVSLSCVPLELEGARVGTVFTFRDITQRKRAEKALRQSDERLRRLFDADIAGIYITDGSLIVEANDHFLKMVGYSREEFAAEGLTCACLTPPSFDQATQRAFNEVRARGVCAAFEREFVRKDGSHIPVLLAGVEVSREEGHVLCFAIDLTDRRNLERQFRQSQKLESIGRLAGGVAHDFNNLLTVILGYSRVAISRAHAGQSVAEPLDEIMLAAERAAALTRQLLTFSRENISEPRDIAVNEIVLGMEKMLRRLIEANIELVIAAGPDAGSIHADPALIELAIINLAVNARDAMPEGGRLFIETSGIEVREDLAAATLHVPAGSYVSLTVTDTGTGMTPEVQSRLFEPFFTTKDPGKGTGLGLSAVYGIVRQSGGTVSVHSSAGLGTTFRLLFPVVNGCGGERAAGGTANAESAGGSETVLLVEDEGGVRSYVRGVLEDAGYRVLDVGNGSDALQIARRYGGEIHLLLTDVALPGMNGNEIVRQFRSIRPGVPALRMSGYPERFESSVHTDSRHLQKPFTPEALLHRIREILDGGKA